MASAALAWGLRGKRAQRDEEASGAHIANIYGELIDTQDKLGGAQEQCEMLVKQRDSLIHNVELLRAERADMVAEAEHIQGRLAKFESWKVLPRNEHGHFIKSAKS